MSLLLGPEPFQKFAVVVLVGGWSKGILEFRFGPNLGLRLEAWTKLNNRYTDRYLDFTKTVLYFVQQYSRVLTAESTLSSLSKRALVKVSQEIGYNRLIHIANTSI